MFDFYSLIGQIMLFIFVFFFASIIALSITLLVRRIAYSRFMSNDMATFVKKKSYERKF